jgi:2-polyprenyl-6-hydroxyphenyl methylase/3-demethylubiquinone-9 3-methyltransferase
MVRPMRFAFGRNWQRFLAVVDEERIAEAERSLRDMLGFESLEGRTFLDIGSGSGLFSLAALRLGAERVHSFDFDGDSVACTRELRRRWFPEQARWTIEQASILDQEYVAGLGRWDVVYAWGVLHHTGGMWRALDLAHTTVDADGRLFVSIYNDQGPRSAAWRQVKRTYNALPPGLRMAFTVAVMGPRELLTFAKCTVRGAAGSYLRGWTNYQRQRGMSRWHDIVDWVGGYPFEVAKPEEVFEFVRASGFRLERLVTRGGGLGCNEFVFTRLGAAPVAAPPGAQGVGDPTD